MFKAHKASLWSQRGRPERTLIRGPARKGFKAGDPKAEMALAQPAPEATEMAALGFEGVLTLIWGVGARITAHA